MNLGPNLGNATWHSGTLAAAKQATLLGIRGIALSAPVADDEPDFSSLEPWIERVLALLLDESCPRLVNVNFPLEPRGIRWTAQAVDQYDGRVVPATTRWAAQHLLVHGRAARASRPGHRPLGDASRATCRSRRCGST